jgi:hypothetical protein
VQRAIVAAAAANKDTVAQERSGSRFASITRPFAKKGLPLRLCEAGCALYYTYTLLYLSAFPAPIWRFVPPCATKWDMNCAHLPCDADGTQGEWEKLHAPVNTFGWKFCHEVELRNKKEFLCARRRPYFRLKETESCNILRARWFMCVITIIFFFRRPLLCTKCARRSLFLKFRVFAVQVKLHYCGGCFEIL